LKILKPRYANNRIINIHTHHEENMPSLLESEFTLGVFVSNSGNESLFGVGNIINKRYILKFDYICIFINIYFDSIQPLFESEQVKELV